MLARVARLPADARRVLEARRGRRRPAGARLLERVRAGRGRSSTRAWPRGVLIADGAVLRFRHEIGRLAVADAVPAHRRGRMHAERSLACAPEVRDDDARAAHHAEGAGDAAAVLEPRPGPRAGPPRWPRTGRRRHSTNGRCASPAASRRRPWPRCSTRSRTSCPWSTAGSTPPRHAWPRCRCWRIAGHRLREGDGLLRLSRALWRLCRGAEAAATAREALAILEPLPPGPELAWAYANLAALAMLEEDGGTAIELARRSAELAERLGRPDILSDALNTEACAALLLGQPWTELLDRSLRVALDAGLEEQAGRAYANLHATHDAERRIADADRIYRQGVAYCDAHDVSTFGTCLRGERTLWLERLGQLGRGRWARRGAADRLGSVAGQPAQSADQPGQRPRPSRRSPRVDGARRGRDRRRTAPASRTGSPWSAWPAPRPPGWTAGRTPPPASSPAPPERPARATAGSGVRSRCGSAGWACRPIPPPACRGRRPCSWPGSGRRRRGGWEDLGCPYEAALARYDSGDDGGLREALRTFDELGATAVARAARRRCAGSGCAAIPTGPRATTRAHRFGLTRREQEVLHLVAAGLPNADISRRLFISERTVDHHVTAVLTKMGVRSRGVAAREAHRLGLLEIPTPRDPSGK